MSNHTKEGTIVANAIYDWHNRQLSRDFISALLCSLTVKHTYQLAHFAKQGVKVRLK